MLAPRSLVGYGLALIPIITVVDALNNGVQKLPRLGYNSAYAKFLCTSHR